VSETADMYATSIFQHINTRCSDVAEERFRMRLIEIEQENSDMKARLLEGESASTSKDGEIAKLRRRLQAAEKLNDSLQHTNAAYEQERRGLEREV